MMKSGIQTHKMSKVKWSFVPLAPSFITTSSWSKININFLEDLEPQITLQPTWSSGAYLLVPRRGNYHFFTLLSSTSDTCWEGEESGLMVATTCLLVCTLAECWCLWEWPREQSAPNQDTNVNTHANEIYAYDFCIFRIFFFLYQYKLCPI